MRLLSLREFLKFSSVMLVISSNDQRRISRKDLRLLTGIGAVVYRPILSELTGVTLSRGWHEIPGTSDIVNPAGSARVSIGRHSGLSTDPVNYMEETGLSTVKLHARIGLCCGNGYGDNLVLGHTRYRGNQSEGPDILFRRPGGASMASLENYVIQRLGPRCFSSSWGWNISDEAIMHRLAKPAEQSAP